MIAVGLKYCRSTVAKFYSVRDVVKERLDEGVVRMFDECCTPLAYREWVPGFRQTVCNLPGRGALGRLCIRVPVCTLCPDCRRAVGTGCTLRGCRGTTFPASMIGQDDRFLVGSKDPFSAPASPTRRPGERDIPWSRDQKIYNRNIAWRPFLGQWRQVWCVQGLVENIEAPAPFYSGFLRQVSKTAEQAHSVPAVKCFKMAGDE